jgi:hypothetical protein
MSHPKFFLTSIALLLFPLAGQAATTYQCSLDVTNGLEVVIEMLTDSSANVTVYQNPKSAHTAAPLALPSPGKVSRTGQVLHVEDPLDGSGVERGKTHFDLDLSSMQLEMPATAEGDQAQTLPCAESEN